MEEALMDEIIENLVEAILKYNNLQAEHWARKAVEAKIDPVEALEASTRTVRQVGDGYGRGELWLPDLVGAASAIQSTMPIIGEQLNKEGVTRKSLGLVILAAVCGANTICFHGGIFGELTFHPVQAIIDNDIAGMIGRFLQGVQVNEETLALDLINEVGPIPSLYLDKEHTRIW